MFGYMSRVRENGSDRGREIDRSRSRVFVDISEQILEPWQTCSGSCQNISWGSARIQFWTPLCGGNGGLRVHPWSRFLGHFLAAFSWPFSAPVLVYFQRPPWSEIKIFQFFAAVSGHVFVAIFRPRFRGHFPSPLFKFK